MGFPAHAERATTSVSSGCPGFLRGHPSHSMGRPQSEPESEEEYEKDDEWESEYEDEYEHEYDRPESGSVLLLLVIVLVIQFLVLILLVLLLLPVPPPPRASLLYPLPNARPPHRPRRAHHRSGH